MQESKNKILLNDSERKLKNKVRKWILEKNDNEEKIVTLEEKLRMKANQLDEQFKQCYEEI